MTPATVGRNTQVQGSARMMAESTRGSCLNISPGFCARARGKRRVSMVALAPVYMPYGRRKCSASRPMKNGCVPCPLTLLALQFVRHPFSRGKSIIAHIRILGAVAQAMCHSTLGACKHFDIVATGQEHTPKNRRRKHTSVQMKRMRSRRTAPGKRRGHRELVPRPYYPCWDRVALIT